LALTIISRAGWGAARPESRTPWNVAALEGICLHWFGSPRAASSHDKCDDLLRSVQRSHMAGEFSDIAYNHGVCPHGTAFELRGWNTQTGANGNADLNSRFYAIVYMAGVGDGLTLAARKTLIELMGAGFKKGIGVAAVGHGTVAPHGTECPGPQLRNFINSGAWRPVVEPDKVRLVLTNGDGKELTHSTAYVPGKDEKAVLESWMKRRSSAILKELRADGDVGIRRVKA
jgi:hypothetical protein